MLDAISSFSTALGLSTASGLNTYIPMLTVSILYNQKLINLAPGYEWVGSGWFMAILIVLCIVEIAVDKIPGADHVNDIVQTFLRPTAGALIFASQSGFITEGHQGVWVTCGLLASGGVHAVKATARPVINAVTFGVGAPVVSTIEDIMSTVMSIVAILLPFLVIGVLILFGWLMWRGFKRFVLSRRNKAVAVAAVPVGAAMTLPSTEPNRTNWGGGV